MEIKFEQAVVALLTLQILLTFMLIGSFNDFKDELFEEDNDSSMSCDCYCDYPYYWYYDYDVMYAEGDDAERNDSHDNSTEDNGN